MIQVTLGANDSSGETFDRSSFLTLEAGLRHIDLYGQDNTRLADGTF